MAKFFDLFPKIGYDIDGRRYTNLQITTNIFFRLGVIQSVMSNISSYYEYLIKDSDKPEDLAFNVYGDAEAHWIILLANNIIDPQHDWPLDTRSFGQYIIKKYGSIEAAKTTVHHYEKITTRLESFSGVLTETRTQINESRLTDNPVPFFETYDDLPKSPSTTVYNLGGGRTVSETVYAAPVYIYDWEDQRNENKRAIKIIKPEYYPQIMNEFSNLTNFASTPFLRRLV